MTTPPQTNSINQFQKAVAETYAGGDFAWVLSEPDWRKALDDCGDTFLTFLIQELSDSEDCTNTAEALKRLQRVADDVEELYDIVETLHENDTAPAE